MCVIRFVFLCVFSAASPPSSPSPTTVLPSTPSEKTSPQPIVKSLNNEINPSTSILKTSITTTTTGTNSNAIVPYENNIVDENEIINNEPSYQNTSAIIKNVEDLKINDENNTNSNITTTTTTNDNNINPVASSITNKITTTTTENVNGNLNSKITETETVSSPGTNNNRMEQLYDIPVGE